VSLPANTIGVIYQNDSPAPLLVTVTAQGSFAAGAQPVTFNSTTNPADQAIASAQSAAARTYLLAPQQGIQVNAPSGCSIDRNTDSSGYVMPELLVALDAFIQEHRRRGELDSSVDGNRVWMACDCGANIAHRFKPPEPLDRPDPQR
jgi:hypothetical protein